MQICDFRFESPTGRVYPRATWNRSTELRIAAKLLVIFPLVLGCKTITAMMRRENAKDAAICKAVKENFLKDKAVDLTVVNVRTTDGFSRSEWYRALTGG